MFLEKCIYSILNQSLEKEIIIVDDGSTDNSFGIAYRLSKQYDCIKIFHQENQGQSVARNKGLKEAKGDYVFFCDSDDFIDYDSLPALYKMCVDKRLDILFTGWRTINNGKISINLPPKGSLPINTPIPATEYFRNSIHSWYIVSPCNGLYRRTFLEKNHLLFPEGIQFEDNTFHLQSLLVDSSAVVMQSDYCFYNVNCRESSTTMTAATPQKVYDQLENIRIMNEFIKDIVEEPYLKELAKVAVSSLVFTMTSYYYRVNKEYRSELDEAIDDAIIEDAILHPQTRFQRYKLFSFRYLKTLLDCYERLRIRNR